MEEFVITRRAVVLGAIAGGSLAEAMGAGVEDDFVRRSDQKFFLKGREYRYIGTNLWYGAYLGASPTTQDRLKRELDFLADLGVGNLRVLGASEVSPLKNSLTPAFRGPSRTYNTDLLAGLDFLLWEMGKRGMKAVIYLNNFWEWSGGMATYLSWVNGGHYIDPNDPAHPWPAFAEFSAGFYANQEANALYHDYVRSLIQRRNTYTGKVYRDDPTIMSWQLANEPRPGGSLATANLPAFYGWIEASARFIKELDGNHLVSTGNEGIRGCLDDFGCAEKANVSRHVDYVTCHIWPLNWSWIDPAKLGNTYGACEANTLRYILDHETLARQIGKPLVLEEFGFPRDNGAYDPTDQTTFRDRYYELVFNAVHESSLRHGPIAGCNFWAWGGEGRAQHNDFKMVAGDTSYVGDPPQEPQGRNSVFNTDLSTLAVVSGYAKKLRAITG
jgi:mannan endo-1,4-beta-mannosidase